MDPAAIVGAIVLAWAISATPYVNVPVSLVLAIFALAYHAPYDGLAVLGAAGIVLGRLTVAWFARGREQRPAAAQAGFAAFAERLRHEPRYRQLSFTAGMIPPIGDMLYSALGAVRAPLRWAALGTFIAELPILVVLTFVFTHLGLLVSTGARSNVHRHDAAVALAVWAIIWIVIGFLQRLDRDHWRRERKIRMRERGTGPFGSFVNGGGAGPFTTGGFGFGQPWPSGDESPDDSDDDEVIEGEVVGEDDDDALPPGDAGRDPDS